MLRRWGSSILKVTGGASWMPQHLPLVLVHTEQLPCQVRCAFSTNPVFLAYSDARWSEHMHKGVKV